ncbi:nucleotide-diphospho-sugar transferase [Dunaliella salina]|uniref:glucose-1-phosphate adenylyltransferase n=1 Tax=Dunaliella salina TaxID=3046 RepID=A0ABQ7GHA7_DUNSA|nr:nucleotide-diphospho-sugar transferase [Dunaliella salina]|eukprot:KAF5833992.1 nucleotide-diphospho-sugar transferase [Dunaliella salina]
MAFEDSPPSNATPISCCTAIILGGGAGSRLFPLTKSRAKPAVPIGGTYRLIDVPMSNCINSGISKIYVLTQFNSTSLNRHLGRAYNMGSGVRFGGDGFVEVLSATQTPTEKVWFQGTADAVRQYKWMMQDVKNRAVEDIVILSGDHLYRMDYMKFVNYHRETNADITIGALPNSAERAKEFGLMKIDDERRVIGFTEKPKTPEALESCKVDTTNAKAHDFGGEIIPEASKRMNVVAYPFYGYWEDIGTVKSFFDENLKLTRHPSEFEFYDPQSPMYTSPRVVPPATIENSKVSESIISQGAFVHDSSITNAIIGLRAIIGKGCTIQDALIMGADYYESESKLAKKLAAGEVPLGVGENCVITNAIIDKNAGIGKNVKIINKEGVEEMSDEKRGIYIRSGIVVVTKGAQVPDNTII